MLEFSCTHSRHSPQVIETLERHGCTVVVKPDPGTPGSHAVQVVMPEDEYQERKCRAIIREWRIVAATYN